MGNLHSPLSQVPLGQTLLAKGIISQDQLSIALTEESYQRAMRDGFFRDFGVPVTGKPRNVKVVVYDYEADRVGSALVRIK